MKIEVPIGYRPVISQDGSFITFDRMELDDFDKCYEYLGETEIEDCLQLLVPGPQHVKEYIKALNDLITCYRAWRTAYWKHTDEEDEYSVFADIEFRFPSKRMADQFRATFEEQCKIVIK